MAKQRTSSAASLTAIVLAVAGAGNAAAATVEWEASAGLGLSDNISRASQDKQSATIGSLGMSFDVTEERRRLDANLKGDLQWLTYSTDSLSSEIAGNAAGIARLAMVEDRLFWSIEDTFGQTREDLFAAATPDNREHVNFFATGPDLQLPLGSMTNLQLGARYSRVDFEKSLSDSQRYGGTLALQRQLSNATQVSLNGSHQRIEPRGASITPSYDRSSAYLRYATAGARTSLAADVGANRVDGGGINSTGALVRLDLSREVGVFSRVTARLGNEFTDSGATFGQQTATPSPVTMPGDDSLVQDAAPYTNRYVELGWDATGLRTSIGLSAGWFDEDFEQGNTLDRQRYSLALTGTRTMTPRTSLTAGIRYSRSEFDAPAAVDNDDLAYNLALAWNAGQRLRMEVAGERSEFSSDASNSSAGETRFWLRLYYGQRRDFANPQP